MLHGMIILDAAPGCEVDGVFYEVGSEYEVGCEEKCMCVASNMSHCVPRCPLVRLLDGDFNPDSCSLKVNPLDPCCKTIHCQGEPN